MRILILATTNNGEQRAFTIDEVPDDTDVASIAIGTFGLDFGAGGNQLNSDGGTFVVELPENGESGDLIAYDNQGTELPMGYGRLP